MTDKEPMEKGKEFVLTLNDKRVVMVEFQEGKPFNVWTTDNDKSFDGYDFTYSKIFNQLYYHNSSGGRDFYAYDGQYWVDEEFLYLMRNYRSTREKVALPDPAKRLLEIPQDLQDELTFAIEKDVVCCSKCEDWFPEDDHCQHVFWCERCGDWSTPFSRSKRDVGGCKHRKPRYKE
jgi:hypothetical protein